MKKDLLICGVGGQGILTISYLIDQTAFEARLNFKQCEIHGMSQRGGAVSSHLRISSEPILSNLVTKGQVDLIISMEPLETLRYLDYLSPQGVVISNLAPFSNIPDYPDSHFLTAELNKWPRSVLLDAKALAEQAGTQRAQNTVMVGAATPFLELDAELIKKQIENLFATKDPKVIKANLQAFELGLEVGREAFVQFSGGA
ncbi:MAG TPA: indolepyruvate oxidoreductase subunit beta [Candidatus Wirthbacteria bacterium]|nr:indolepyruvate oxidoreductase subunit beta [Candidatus Wirthbacteria bacterium]